ncbi:hypothetical protein SAMN05421788_10656 [Filimonas lacunae]|uniref:Uncharacterized protein n=1 Tax=Filimonas lacunae TaxID=477680 RepID=A0A173MEF8_9BACT|nr:DUF5908 family protein [Filimonas lacunae]BAV05982.1 hypothetical protein FLA_1997 [Filimonas lacunae]SIT24036.1 hypothetical protein SAMN05421788_10656 [Filimonas lacunae]
MPLEIRELVIKVTVEEQAGRQQQADLAKTLQTLKNQVVKECMDQIKTKLENSLER